ncbi:MAG: ABC transporter ATP-binding protein [Rickettsia endosymbiont of Culicoides impunctatus]|uniref:ABC transporter ATP-binding protein n=1 Tax=unclassified Candidatus Tisiphia TaxID=2996318 RepID=UPI001D283F86|nr:MAG: ABC transporter ATP-binding protein [Rickettsia endosymbiont of Culicoides impunctatus]HJD63860.1 ABC transporter ATP-binding protein [Rickettsia endosymbiont of Sericostoma sp.]
MILLEVKELNKSYVVGELIEKVLKNVSFQIPEGKVVALLGPSGSGKSTLLSIIGSIMSPTSGKVILRGQEISTLSENQLTTFRNTNIGFVFQFHHLLSEFSVLENVYFPAAGAKGYVTKEITDYAKYLIEYVGLRDHIHNKASKLSGGQKQRVAIARALINKPQLVLADEPTGNLDHNSTLQVMKLILEINKHYNTTFIISTHNNEIANYCTSNIQMLDGMII